MTPEETAFRRAIAAAPADEAPRKVFADWLDEHDRPEEAAWYRTWTTAAAAAAREWLTAFAAGHDHDPAYYLYRFAERETADPPGRVPVDDLIRAAREWYAAKARGDEWPTPFTQMGSASLRDFMSESLANRRAFWRAWALATGTFVPAEIVQTGYVFSCSC